jgi:hypothetical protein
MTPKDQSFRARPLATEVAARAIPREDARWVRPVFRPPPLTVKPARPEMPYPDATQRTEPTASSVRASSLAR